MAQMLDQELPSVSVIIPTYNRGHLVERAIESVLTQTFQDLAVFVVDDASEDATGRIVRRFNDARLTYLRHSVNRGAGAARNTGLREASGEYVAFLDSDDEWLPTKLEKQLHTFQQGPPNLAVVYTGIRFIDLDTGDFLGTQAPQARGHILDLLLRTNVVVGSNSTAMVRRAFLEASGGFDESLPARQDVDLWIRLAKHYSFDYVDEILVHVYVHRDRITEDSAARVEGAKLLFRKIRAELEENPQLLAEGHYTVARELFKAGRIGEGQRRLRRALRAFPFRVKYYGAFLASCVGSSCFARMQKLWLAIKSRVP